ncbi:MAG TPA: efflux transporter outer membrane subunit [Rhizomicrobium sp.]|nr:efflux transporter outer membrane subunit [Rhizomicrobium sp.]
MAVLRRSIPAIALCFGLAACEVGPDYQLPRGAVVNAPVAQGAFAGARNAAITTAKPAAQWWRLYHSAVLDGFITQALAANTDLRVADANLERAHALLQAARVARQPTVGFDFETNYGQLSAEQYIQPRLIPTSVFYDLGLSASYEVDLFGRLKRGIEAAHADDEAALAARDLARVAVAAATTGAYTDYCSAGEELAAARRTLALTRRRFVYVRNLLTAGRGTTLEVTEIRGLVAQTESDIPVFQARQRNALFRIATLTARPPEKSGIAISDCNGAAVLAVPIPVGDGASLLRRRPDVREAERELAAATARIGVATADLYPDVTLGATVGSTGVMTDILKPLTNRYGVGPGITWELNQNAARARIDAAEAQTRAALARFDGVVLDALRETETALSNYAHALDRDDKLREARARAQQAFADSVRLESAGRTDSLQTLDAERTLASAEFAVAASQSEIASDQVALFLALGGGWENAPAVRDAVKSASRP